MLKQNLLISRDTIIEKINQLRWRNEKPQEIQVTFVKKDGSLRFMCAKIGVKAGVSGEGLSWSPSERNMIAVHEVRNKDLKGKPAKDKKRLINIETILNIKIDGHVYQVVDNLSENQINSVNEQVLKRTNQVLVVQNSNASCQSESVA